MGRGRDTVVLTPAPAEQVLPDGKWRIAATDSIYYFPSDRPDLGVDVFLLQLDTNDNKSSQWAYGRRYTWGDKNSFYLDNDGGVACVWKTDIEKNDDKNIAC